MRQASSPPPPHQCAPAPTPASGSGWRWAAWPGRSVARPHCRCRGPAPRAQCGTARGSLPGRAAPGSAGGPRGWGQARQRGGVSGAWGWWWVHVVGLRVLRGVSRCLRGLCTLAIHILRLTRFVLVLRSLCTSHCCITHWNKSLRCHLALAQMVVKIRIKIRKSTEPEKHKS